MVAGAFDSGKKQFEGVSNHSCVLGARVEQKVVDKYGDEGQFEFMETFDIFLVAAEEYLHVGASFVFLGDLVEALLLELVENLTVFEEV